MFRSGIVPKLEAGYACPASPWWIFAKYPSLWNRCTGAYAPGLGYTGNQLYDWSGGNRNGTLTGMSPADDWIASRGQYALDFSPSYNPTPDHVVCGLLPAQTSQHTTSIWFNLNSQTMSGGVFYTDYNSSGEICRWDARYDSASPGTSKLQIFFQSGPGNYQWINGITLPQPNANEWYHFCWVCRGTASSDQDVYLNGQKGTFTHVSPLGTPAIPTTGFTTTSFARPTGGINGMLDDFMAWDRALDPGEVQLLAQSRCVAYEVDWDMVMRAQAATVISIGLNSESDSAFTFTHSKAEQIGIVDETDSVFSITHGITTSIGLNTETDSAFAFTFTKTEQIGIVEETDSAFDITHQVATQIGLVEETDSAFAFTFTKTEQIGLVEEIDSAFSVTASFAGAIGLVEETDSVFPFSIIKVEQIGLVVETDGSHTFTITKVEQIGLVEETDSAFDIGISTGYTIGIVGETDSALAFLHYKVEQIGLATETDLALPFSVELEVLVAGIHWKMLPDEYFWRLEDEMSVRLIHTPLLSEDDTEQLLIDYTEYLRVGETIIGTPTIIDEDATGDLTINNIIINSSEVIVDGYPVEIAHAVQFNLTGQQAGTEYNLHAEITTSAGRVKNVILPFRVAS